MCKSTEEDNGNTPLGDECKVIWQEEELQRGLVGGETGVVSQKPLETRLRSWDFI